MYITDHESCPLPKEWNKLRVCSSYLVVNVLKIKSYGCNFDERE